MDCGKDWSGEHIELIIERGPHSSANWKKAVRQLRQETEDKVKHKYAIIVKYGDIKNDIPKKLKISPVPDPAEIKSLKMHYGFLIHTVP